MDMNFHDEEANFFQAELSYACSTVVRTVNVAGTARQLVAVLSTSFPQGTVFLGSVLGVSHKEVAFRVWVALPSRVRSSVMREWIADAEEPSVKLVSVSCPQPYENDGMFFARTRGSDGIASDVGVYVTLAELEGLQRVVAGEVLVKHADGMRDSWGRLPHGVFLSSVLADTDWERRCEDMKFAPPLCKGGFALSEWVQSERCAFDLHGIPTGGDAVEEGSLCSSLRTYWWVQAQALCEELVCSRASGR
jgi:hypothetical protein